MNSSDEKEEVSEDQEFPEEEIEAVVETRKKRRHYLWYLPFGFLVAVGCLTIVKDSYDLYEWLQTLPSYQTTFWDLDYGYKFEFLVAILRSVSLGLTQIVAGWLLYVYSRNRT